jgi:hypothetical protein
LLVGAEWDDDKGKNSGSAYVFTRGAFPWKQQAKLVADDGAQDARFGWSVAIEGTTALVGAYGDPQKGKGAGAAYVFTQSGATWKQQAKLVAMDLASRSRSRGARRSWGRSATMRRPSLRALPTYSRCPRA